jgi:Helix-loop-helix DNA-binding domain
MLSVSLRSSTTLSSGPDFHQDLDHVDRSIHSPPPSSKSHDNTAASFAKARSNLTYASSDQDWRLGTSLTASIMAGQQSGNPFGYSFYQHQHQQNHEPEMPEPGSNPLLNPREDGFLAQFYSTHPQSHAQAHHDHSQVDFRSVNGRQQAQIAMGAGTPTGEGTPEPGFGWLMSEPPPIVHDINATPIPVPNSASVVHQNVGAHAHHVTTPLSAHSLLDYGFPGQNHNQMSNEDILGATILSQPVHHAQNYLSPQMASQQRVFQQQQSQMSLQSSTTTPVMEPIHTQAALESLAADHNNSNGHNHHHLSLHSSGLMNLIPRLDTSAATLQSNALPHFTVPQTAPPLASRRNRFGTRDPNPRLYDFGTDTRFEANGFRPGSEQERHDFREERLTEELKMLKPINRTPNPSVPPSPAYAHVGHGQYTDLMSSGVKRQREDDLDDSPSKRARGDSPGPKRKRRASAPGAPTISSAKKHKRGTSDDQDDAELKAEEARQASKRDPLNDEQKRQNHIASEQKRRNQIREGFEDLNKIVPDLKEGGFSKSAVLVEVAAFAMKLIRNNDELRKRLGIRRGEESESRLLGEDKSEAGSNDS